MPGITPARRLRNIIDQHTSSMSQGDDFPRFDSLRPVLLVERHNRSKMVFLTTHASLDAAADYHVGQEHAEDWAIEYAVHLQSGVKMEPGRTVITWQPSLVQ